MGFFDFLRGKKDEKNMGDAGTGASSVVFPAGDDDSVDATDAGSSSDGGSSGGDGGGGGGDGGGS
jgi:hypothetical protein